MSKYRYEFGVSIHREGSEVTSVVDLVDDFGYSESELDEMSDAKFADVMLEELEDFEHDNIEPWVKTLDGSRGY